MKPKLPSSVAVVALLLGSTPLAQRGAEAPSQELSMQARLDAWRASHGTSWRQRVDEETGHSKLLFGGRARPAFQPVLDADFGELARGSIEEARPLLGIGVDTLVQDRASFLPLGIVGTTDKLAVRFVQAVDGVPVRGASVNALYLATGELISLASTALPALGGFDTTPTVSAETASDVAARAFVQDVGAPATRIGTPQLVIAQERAGKIRFGTLAWEVDVAFEQPGFPGEAYRYRIAARGLPRIVQSESLIHHWDVGGQVVSNATPGVLPDGASNPPVQQAMRYMTVTSVAGTTTTDSNGNFNFPGVNGPLNVTVSYAGTFNDVQNTQGSNYSLTVSLTGTGNTIVMNPTPTEFVTSQANAFHIRNLQRDWIRSVNPADSSADFLAPANVNINASCNAYYDGSSTNFYAQSTDCVNTAYSTVAAHELGHWMNDVYGSGNGPDGFGEGNADVFAMYLFDNPIVGEDFRLSGSDIRTGLNTRTYCGDGNPGCYGEVHADGEVLMGALWKVRDNFNSTYGNTGGDMLADALFNAWMLAFDQPFINSDIEVQWICLDDDDGIIENGSPNFADIDAGFVAQGFPGYELSDVIFRNVVRVDDTLDGAGPYGVSAELTALNAASVSSATLHYQVNGGSFGSVPMSQASGPLWTALIPGVGSPAKVGYYIEAMDSNGMTDTLPADAPASLFDFRVGLLESFLLEDFEGGDNGWTHAQVATQDDWQHDVPAGASGTSSGVDWSDPSSAYSGTRVWGNDLGGSGFNGAYQPNVENYLRSPQIDLSGAHGTFLRMRRWLTVERGIYDQAQIRVNGTVVWENDLLQHTVDTSWTDFSVDISDVADGDPSAEIEFRLVTDGGLNLGGWNIDDFELLALDATPTDCLPTTYGSGVPGANGIPVIDSEGQPSRRGNADFHVAVKNGLPNASAYIAVGSLRWNRMAFVGPLLVHPVKIFRRTLDVFGRTTLPMPIPDDPGLVGTSFFFQAFIADSTGPGSFAATQGLQVTVCD